MQSRIWDPNRIACTYSRLISRRRAFALAGSGVGAVAAPRLAASAVPPPALVTPRRHELLRVAASSSDPDQRTGLPVAAIKNILIGESNITRPLPIGAGSAQRPRPDGFTRQSVAIQLQRVQVGHSLSILSAHLLPRVRGDVRCTSLPRADICVSAVMVGSYFNLLLPIVAGMARILRESGVPFRKCMTTAAERAAVR